MVGENWRAWGVSTLVGSPDQSTSHLDARQQRQQSCTVNPQQAEFPFYPGKESHNTTNPVLFYTACTVIYILKMALQCFIRLSYTRQYSLYISIACPVSHLVSSAAGSVFLSLFCAAHPLNATHNDHCGKKSLGFEKHNASFITSQSAVLTKNNFADGHLVSSVAPPFCLHCLLTQHTSYIIITV